MTNRNERITIGIARKLLAEHQSFKPVDASTVHLLVVALVNAMGALVDKPFQEFSPVQMAGFMSARSALTAVVGGQASSVFDRASEEEMDTFIAALCVLGRTTIPTLADAQRAHVESALAIAFANASVEPEEKPEEVKPKRWYEWGLN